MVTFKSSLGLKIQYYCSIYIGRYCIFFGISFLFYLNIKNERDAKKNIKQMFIVKLYRIS